MNFRIRRDGIQIALVQRNDQRRAGLAEQRLLLLAQRTGAVNHQQHHICAAQFLPRAVNADALHLIRSFAQACGIGQLHGQAVQVQLFAQHVARSACRGGNDGTLFPQQPVEQRGFARVRAARQHDAHAAAEHSARPCVFQGAFQFFLDGSCLLCGLLRRQRFDVLVRIIQIGLDISDGIEQFALQCMDTFGKIPPHLLQTGARGALRAGAD